VDTNIVSYLMKESPLARDYRRHLANHSLAISFMTLAELYEGAARSNWGAEKRRSLEEILATTVVIWPDTNVCVRWGEVRAARRHQPISPDDAWIAAVALEAGWPLVTHNARDFRTIPGLTVVSESI